MSRRGLAAFVLAIMLMAVPTSALASGDGGGYWVPGGPTVTDVDAQQCQTRTWVNPEGKTPNGTHVVATDGCHVYEFTTTIGAGPASGTTTFMAADLAMGLEPYAYNARNQCEFAAISQANLAFINYFKVPSGTMVRVTYNCD
jgi:hypothetical protein